jgi:hypothetical protein
LDRDIPAEDGGGEEGCLAEDGSFEEEESLEEEGLDGPGEEREEGADPPTTTMSSSSQMNSASLFTDGASLAGAGAGASPSESESAGKKRLRREGLLMARDGGGKICDGEEDENIARRVASG